MVFLYSHLLEVSAIKVKHEINWNPLVTEKLSFENIFEQDVNIGEYMDIICPQYDEDQMNIMMFEVYNVTKEVFDSCGKINEGAEKLLSCHNPRKTTKLTMKFQKFSPNPRGFIFYPEESYYLIAILNGYDEHNSQANCGNKMRMEIKVHQRRHHNNFRKTEKITTVIRNSPKFLVTKPETKIARKISVNHAETFKTRDASESSSIKTTSNIYAFMTTILIWFLLSL